ncbi:hypothetical protein DKG71_31420 [Streptomyces sp. NEAU-S7GS2]|nr:hypothetical protein DKG71_31420 [Streptomyces sp. NEAU-S7GS2]
MVEGSFRQGLKVLFLAPTNVAVDQALERMCSLLEHEEGFAEGIVQRAGTIVLPSLRSRYGDQVDPARIAALLVESIDHRSARRPTSSRVRGRRWPCTTGSATWSRVWPPAQRRWRRPTVTTPRRRRRLRLRTPWPRS